MFELFEPDLDAYMAVEYQNGELDVLKILLGQVAFEVHIN